MQMQWKHAIIGVGFLAVAMSTGCDKLKGSVKLDTDRAKASYAIGTQIGQNIKSQSVDADPRAIAAGIDDALHGTTPKLKPEEMQAALMKLQEASMKKHQEEGEANKKKGQEFLDKNKTQEGWKTTASGLQYKVEKEGAGEPPKDTDLVEVQYTGTLTTGEKFDSSVDRGKPAEFPVNGVIPGWTEALKLMKPGAKWKLAIPPELAYGPMGRPGIPANSVLLFDVELVSAKSAPAGPTGGMPGHPGMPPGHPGMHPGAGNKPKK